MTRLIVHIGQAKTGTSTLQNALATSREMLLSSGVLYPTSYPYHSHIDVVTHLGGLAVAPAYANLRHQKQRPNALLRESEEAWNRLVGEVKQHAPHTIILSCEDFWGIAARGDFASFLSKMKSLADQVTFVAYLRTPSSLYLSLKQQDLKYIGMCNPPNFGDALKTSLAPFALCQEVQLDVHKFDRSSLIEGDIRVDFARRYLAGDAEKALDTSGEDRNISMSAEAMAILEEIWSNDGPVRYARSGPVHKSLSETIMDLDRHIPNRSQPKLKPGIARIMHDTAIDLDWLAETHDIRFATPDHDPATQGILARDLKRVRDLCEIDEQRYRLLWNAVPVSRKQWLIAVLKRVWRGQKYIARARKRTLRLMRDTFRSTF